jgi:predicted amidohydrolase
LAASSRAFEALWGQLLRLQHGAAGAEQARHCRVAPRSIAIAETLGGDPEHDRARLESVLTQALEEGVLSDVTIASSETERRAIWAIREDVWQTKNIAPLLTFDVSLPIENMKAYTEEVCGAVHAFAGPNRAFVFGHMADGNLHLVIAAGDDAADAGTRRRHGLSAAGGDRRVGVGRTWHRPREARLSTVVAHRRRDFDDAAAQERTRPRKASSTPARYSHDHSSAFESFPPGGRRGRHAVRVWLGRGREHRERRKAGPPGGEAGRADHPHPGAVRNAVLLHRTGFASPAHSPRRSPTTGPSRHFTKIARELDVVLPISFFEKAHNSFFNSIAILDADGTNLGVYRKAHIPNGPGYQEKNYFSPGDTGFKVWDTKYARIGVGICWDQWFPECARAMALMGAELLFYPTAIGSEPPPALPVNFARSLAATQQGSCGRESHASDRLESHWHGARAAGIRKASTSAFYGSSFIADSTGRRLPRRMR